MVRLLILNIILLAMPIGKVWAQQVGESRIGFDIEGNKKKAEFKFENYNNLIIIPVLINDVLPVKFILDSGVSNTILTERSVSDFLSINYDRKIPLMGTDGSKVIDAFVAANVSMKIPGVESQGHGILVLAEDYLQLKNYLGVEVHGIIGYELFRRFVVKIDYDRTMITLYEPEHFKPKKSDHAFDIVIEDSKAYMDAMVQFEGGDELDLKLMMDTGASHSILLDAESHDGINVPEPNIQGVLGRGLGGDILGYIGRVERVKFFDFTFDQVIGSFPINESLYEMFKKNQRQGTIGGGIFSKFKVTVDYINGKIYLKPSAKYKESFEYNMSGIEVKADGRNLNRFFIHNIRPNSPATDAGIEEGDEILYINGDQAKNIKLNDINAFFRSKEGKKIKMTILRNGQRIKKTFKLRKLI